MSSLIASALMVLTFVLPQDAAEAASPQTESGTDDNVPTEPPKPGPDLLKYTPEQIEKSYEGQRIPEAVEMYLVIARGGQLDGSGGWFHPAVSRFSWERLATQQGGNPGSPVNRDQFKGDVRIFDQLDRDHDGSLSGFDLDWSDTNPWVRQSYMINRIFRRLDPSGDGSLTSEEWNQFFGKVSKDGEPLRFEQLRDALMPSGGGMGPGDMPSKETLIKGLLEEEIGSLQEGPQVDELAPDFAVSPLAGGDPVKLSDRIGKKPVVLVFGNFTCGPFRSMYPTVEAVWRRQKDHADFLFIYVREAHPTDGWAMKSNEKVGVAVAQPKTFEERRKVAEQCSALLKPSIPLFVDDIDDTVGATYSGMPARLYVIDSQGKVAYKSGRGPFGFKPEEMEQALLMLQLEEAAEKSSHAAADQKEIPMKAAVKVLSDAEAWERLPKAVAGSGQPLPVWCRAVATQLPRTAAAMLNLDIAHRTKSPLNPVLRAKMRWIVANANHCEYSRQYAIFDLKQAGASAEVIRCLEGGSANWPKEDQEPLEFARMLTLDAPNIPDALFESLRSQLGDEKVASMVLLAAYGNFQDRIVLGLQLPMEEQGPRAPVKVEFAEGALQMASLIPNAPAQTSTPTGKDVVEDDSSWTSLTFDQLQDRLEKQRARKPRLPIPTWDDVKGKLPPQMATRPTRIVWSLMTYGYAAELQIPWSISTRTHWAERPGDRVFEESLFWIQTRTIECNYCMGHCEMLLEVAGLDSAEVKNRTSQLASDDWSAFSPEEQRAYAYARKLSKAPWTLTAEDYSSLEKDLGPADAMSTFWWLCRGLYMTRISDGFQLPLEKENVFAK